MYDIQRQKNIQLHTTPMEEQEPHQLKQNIKDIVFICLILYPLALDMLLQDETHHQMEAEHPMMQETIMEKTVV